MNATWHEGLQLNYALAVNSAIVTVCLRDPNLLITIPAYALAPDGARPSVGTLLSTKLGIFVLDSVNVSDFVLHFWPDDIIQNGQWNLTKSQSI